MKKRGFTLVEMLAVLVLVVILSLIVFPSIINYINSSKGDISNVTKEMILSNAKLYVSDNKLTYPSDEGYSYCMTLKKLADKNYIETPFKDSATGEEIDLENTYIKVQYIYDYDLKTLKYTYDIVDSCTPGIADGYTMVFTTGSVITLDNKEIVDYKIYGNSEGIKNITIKTSGKNLLSVDDWYGFYKKNGNANYINMLTNNNNLISWVPAVGYNGAYIEYPLLLKPNTQYTIKYKCKMAILNPGQTSTGFGFIYTDDNISGSYCDDTLDWVEKTMTSLADKQVKALYMPYNYGHQIIVDAGSVILEEGISATYEPYKDIKQNIQVSNALKENDYVEYKSNTIFREDKTEEKINLPKIETYDGISNIIIIDENKNYPSKVEVLIRNKNKA